MYIIWWRTDDWTLVGCILAQLVTKMVVRGAYLWCQRLRAWLKSPIRVLQLILNNLFKLHLTRCHIGYWKNRLDEAFSMMRLIKMLVNEAFMVRINCICESEFDMNIIKECTFLLLCCDDIDLIKSLFRPIVDSGWKFMMPEILEQDSVLFSVVETVNKLMHETIPRPCMKLNRPIQKETRSKATATKWSAVSLFQKPFKLRNVGCPLGSTESRNVNLYDGSNWLSHLNLGPEESNSFMFIDFIKYFLRCCDD